MKILRALSHIGFLIALKACTTNTTPNLFDSLLEKDSVAIYLSQYHLDSIPEDIGQLVNCKKLYIHHDTLEWNVYPPLSAWPTFITKHIETLPLNKLPASIGNLKQLQRLSITNLNLSELPTELGKLEELQYLNIALNKLDIIDELEVLASIPNLKEVTITGNKIATVAIQVWNTQFPNLKISY